MVPCRLVFHPEFKPAAPVGNLSEFDKEGKIWFDTMHQGASVSFRVFGSNRREQMRLRLISCSDRHNATIPSHFVCER
jgi:hypothetical protein